MALNSTGAGTGGFAVPKTRLTPRRALGNVTNKSSTANRSPASSLKKPVFEEQVVDCHGCNDLTQQADQLKAEMGRTQAEAEEYRSLYERIQGEGARLLEAYQTNTEKLGVSQEKMVEMEETIERLADENKVVKVEYDKIYEAYEELVDNYNRVEAELESAQAVTSPQQPVTEPVVEPEQTNVAAAVAVAEAAAAAVRVADLEFQLTELRLQLEHAEDDDGEDGESARSSTLRISNQLLRDENKALETDLEDKEDQLARVRLEAQQLARAGADKEQQMKQQSVHQEQFQESYDGLLAQIKSYKSQVQALQKREAASKGDKDALDRLALQVQQGKEEADNLRYDLALLHKQHKRHLKKLEGEFHQDEYKAKYAKAALEVQKLQAELQQTCSSVQAAEHVDGMQAELQQHLMQKASTMLKYSDQFKTELELISQEKEQLQQVVHGLRRDLLQMQEGKQEQEHTLKELTARNEALLAGAHSSERQSLCRELVKHVKDKNSSSEEMWGLQSALEARTAQVADLVQERTQLHAAYTELEEQHGSLSQQLDLFRTEMDSIRREKDELSEFNDEERRSMSELVMELENELEAAKSELDDSKSEQVKLHNIQMATIADSQEKDRVINELEANLEEAGRNLEQAIEQLQEGEDRTAEHRAQQEDLRASLGVAIADHNAVSIQLQQTDEACAGFEADVLRLTSELHAEVARAEQMQVEADEALEQSRAVASRLSRGEMDLEFANKKMEACMQESQALKKQLKTFKETISSRDKQITELKNEVQASALTGQCLKKQLQELKQQLAHGHDQASQKDAEKAKYERQLAKQQAALARATKEVCSSSEKISEYRQQVAQAEGRADALQDQLRMLQSTSADAAADLRLVQAASSTQAQSLEEVQRGRKEAHGEIFRLEKENTRLQDRLHSLSEHLAAFGGNTDAGGELQKLVEKTMRLKKANKSLKTSNATSVQAQQQLRQYILLYKEKADEKQLLTEQALSDQSMALEVLDGKLRQARAVLSRHASLLDAHPELGHLAEALSLFDEAELDSSQRSDLADQETALREMREANVHMAQSSAEANASS